MRRAIILPLLIAASLTLSVTGRAESKPSPELAPPGAPKSEFTVRPGFTKDPFFPRSTDVVLPQSLTSTQTQTPSTVPDYVTLKGVSMANGRKLAIINDRTVGEGEEFTLKRSGSKPVNLRLVEIKAQSVVVSVDGATKELSLRAR